MFLRKFWRLLKKPKSFPSNVLVLATHGSAAIPSKVFPSLSSAYQQSLRLLLNYSDYGTSYLLKEIPEEHRLMPLFGRLAGDPNRSLKSDDLFRFQDFGGVHIFHPDFEDKLTHPLWKYWHRFKLLNQSYFPYYRQIYRKIRRLSKDPLNQHKPIIILDIHDTGHWLLGPTPNQDRVRSNAIPKILLSNAPDLQTGEHQWGTCPEPWLEFLRDTMAQKLGIKQDHLELNTLFKGGNIIRTFGNPYSNKKLKRAIKGHPIFAVQIEFNRSLYMDEHKQKPKWLAINDIRRGFTEALNELDLYQGADIQSRLF